MGIIAAFVCHTLTDFEKEARSSWILEPLVLEKVLDWYCPDWFSDYLNRLADNNGFHAHLTYEIVMGLWEKGLVKPGSRLVATTLPALIVEAKRNGNSWDTLYTPEKLFRWPITIQQHIWYLFEEESVINGIRTTHYSAPDEEKAEKSWQGIFKKFAEDGTIERKRLLKEALQATNKNFNKSLSAWFIDLFLALKPTDEELIELQPVLFNVLNAPNGKSVTTALTLIKKISGHQQFNLAAFIDNAAVLLSSKVKSTVSAALMILEKLAKNNASFRPAICKSVTQVFMQSDDELQSRAAKIIDACRDSLDASFAAEIAVFESSMMSSARNLLQDMLQPADPETPAIHLPTSAERTPIPPIESFEDFIFLASEAVDNNNSYVIDLLPASFLKMRHTLKGENIAKLQPALQRALKIMTHGLRSQQGWLDHMLAVFIIDACIYLISKYPTQGESLRIVFENNEQRLLNNQVRKWLGIGDKTYLEGWSPHSQIGLYKTHKHFLNTALKMLREGSDCPLLSTPTHEPGWIEPVTLVERLAIYHQKQIEPDSLDWQIAVSRCSLQDTEEAATLAGKLLSGEKLNILLFLFGKHAEPQAPIMNPAVWMAASVAKKEKKKYQALEDFSFYTKPFAYYTGQYAWQVSTKEYINKQYDYAKRQYIDQAASAKLLEIFATNETVHQEEFKLDKPGLFARLFSKAKSGLKKNDGPLLYDLLHMNSELLLINQNDMRRVMLLAPNNLEPLLAGITARALKYSGFSGEGNKKSVIAALQVLHEVWDNAGNMAHLFLGACMLAGDKTVQNIAGEIWLKGVTGDNIDNAFLGNVIGRHQSIEFAPLKRLTDLIMQQLFRVSSQHNKALQIIIENMMAELPETPVKGIKKLLEIYNELLVVNKSEPHAAIAEKMKTWKKAK
jgi:hypothetical protein